MRHRTPQVILVVAGSLLLFGSWGLYASRTAAHFDYVNGPLAVAHVILKEKDARGEKPVAQNYYPTGLIGALALIAGVATWNLSGSKPAK